MINIAICDDQEQEVEIMYGIVFEKFTEFNIPFKIVKCSNGEDLLYEMNEVGDFDLIFLDIELGVDNGIDAAAKIRELSPYCYIVFVSGYNRYYKAAFSVQPYQFLDKPINELEMKKVIDSVSELIIDNNQVFAFEYKWKQYRIHINDILYFISDHRMITLYTKDDSVYEFYGKMNEVEARLRKMSFVFLRIHKSYLVNMNYIKIFGSDDVLMQDGESFQISIRKRKTVIEHYMSFARFSM